MLFGGWGGGGFPQLLVKVAWHSPSQRSLRTPGVDNKMYNMEFRSILLICSEMLLYNMHGAIDITGSKGT